MSNDHEQADLAEAESISVRDHHQDQKRQEEVRLLESLVGKQVTTYQSFHARDESGFDHFCIAPSPDGILRSLEYDPKTFELEGIWIGTAKGSEHFSLNPQAIDSVYAIETVVYHRGERVVEKRSAPHG